MSTYTFGEQSVEVAAENEPQFEAAGWVRSEDAKKPAKPEVIPEVTEEATP